MRRKLLVLIQGLLATSTVLAQSSVTLDGSIDEGVTYNTNARGHSLVTAGPVAAPDFFGLRGSEDLGGGLKAIFALQDGFLSNTGASTIAGSAFSHFSWVGLSGKVGAVTIGRQLDLITDTLRYNSNGFLQYSFYFFHPGNLDNLAVMADSINNSVKYTSPNLSGFTFSGLYGFDDTTTQPGRVISAAVVYKGDRLRASAVYSSWHDHAINLGSTLGFGSFLGQSLRSGALFNAQHQNIAGVSALYQLTARCEVHGMATQVDIAAPSGSARMRTAEAGADIHTNGQNTVTLGGYVSWFSATRYIELGAGEIYALSKSTIVYAQAVYQHAGGAGDAAIALLGPASGPGQAALRVGLHHFF